MKNKNISARRKITLVFPIVFLLLVAVAFGGLKLLGRANETAMKKVTVTAITNLLQQGTYASIKPYVTADFLGDATEAEFDENAKPLFNIKDSNVEVQNVSEAGVFGIITPVNPETQENYLFAYSVSLKKTGFNSYKIVSIETDYGRQSFFDPIEDETN